MISKLFIKITFPVIVILAVYFLGPMPDAPVYDLSLPALPEQQNDLEKYIAEGESKHKIKPDNEARIVWLDSSKRKTEFAVVYLHGFSASQMEGNPVHRRFAKEFGCNLFLSRLSDHGVDTTESLLYFTADRVWNSAKEALAIGNAIGEKVILVSTSTGGTLALKLAAEFPDKVYGLINLSPNIAINHPAAFISNNAWGLQIGRMVMGGDYRITEANEEKSKYWNNKYRLESVVQLEELLESSMTKETFQRVKQPSLTLYYYKNEKEQDPEVKVSAMLEMHKALGTPESLKEEKAIPNAEAHVIGGSLVSKDVESVYLEMQKFAIEKLKMKQQTLAVQ
jgi:pimeloyl-ACP methyl ester carboxylesterase